MPNTFAGCEIKDSLACAEVRAKAHAGHFLHFDRANSVSNPSGPSPVRGWFFVDADAYELVDESVAQSAVLLDGLGNRPTLYNLYIVGARTPARGVDADGRAVYLVEVTDVRGLLKNRWFQFPTISRYNVRSPAYDGLYYSDSLSAGTAWTWTGMVQNLWEQMTLLGTYPGLPLSPSGTPDGWSFPGVGAWDALTSILDNLGCVVTCDLTLASNQYSIKHRGDADATATALFAAKIDLLQEDESPFDTGAARTPGTVKVYFHRRNRYYGTEETVRRDSSQWTATPLHQESVSTGTGAPGVNFLWDDFTVRYDEDGSPLAADVTTAGTIAAARVGDYLSAITHATGEMRQVYSGLQPFKTGSLVDGVRYWHGHDYTGRRDWQTEVVRDPYGRWRVNDGGCLCSDKREVDASNQQAPILGPQLPVYPVVSQELRSYGAPVGGTPYTGNVYTAYTQQLVVGTGLRDREAAYLWEPNGNTVAAGTWGGRLVGVYNSLPLYVVGGGGVSTSGATTFAGIINTGIFAEPLPAAVNIGSSPQNNYPAVGTAFFTINPTVPVSLTGIVPANSGQLLNIVNTGAETITIPSSSGSSSAANQFKLPTGTGTSMVIPPITGAVPTVYDTNLSRWVPFLLPVFTPLAPAQITSNQNNYATGTADKILVNSDAARTITGLDGGWPEREITLTNNGSFAIAIDNDSGSSTSANRVIVPGGTNFSLQPNASAKVKWDSSISKYRLMTPVAVGGSSQIRISKTVPNASVTAVNVLDSVLWDDGFNAGGANFVFPATGKYLLEATAVWNSDAGLGVGNRGIAFTYSGSSGSGGTPDIVMRAPAWGGASFGQPVFHIVDGIATESVGVNAYQDSGGNLNMVVILSIYRLS